MLQHERKNQRFAGRTMLTVACVLSPGGIYNHTHVERLKKMVQKNMRQEYNFVCVEDSPFSGFWAKISLFEPRRFQGRVLYLDLDVTVKGNLDDLANHQGQFMIVKDWFRFGFNSSIMAWDAGIADHIYLDYVAENCPKIKGGDQSYIMQKMPSAHIFPRNWVQSFKKACFDGGFMPDLRVIAFHGFPKPWQLTDFT